MEGSVHCSPPNYGSHTEWLTTLYTHTHTHTHYKVLDGDFAPFAAVVQGMEALDLIFKVGEGGASGGPSQQRITSEGNVYLDKEYVGE